LFKTVLVAADGSETAARAVSTAAELVKVLGGTLHVVNAYRPDPVRADKLPGEFSNAPSEPADLLLSDLRLAIENAGVKAEYHAAKGDPAEAIVRIADRIEADLIVVGNKGMKGVRRVLGSVPNSVAHQANCSVLIVDTVPRGED
jgi:nucleotide-binding universal stress UspA family protein